MSEKKFKIGDKVVDVEDGSKGFIVGESTTPKETTYLVHWKSLGEIRLWMAEGELRKDE